MANLIYGRFVCWSVSVRELLIGQNDFSEFYVKFRDEVGPVNEMLGVMHLQIFFEIIFHIPQLCCSTLSHIN